MKNIKHIVTSLFLLVFISAFIINCENDHPNSLWNPDESSNPQPVVSEIVPADSTFAGLGEMVIKGQNFSTTPEENLVFFSGNKADVVSSTETELTIKTPKIPGDSLEIKIAVHQAELFSEPVLYKLIPAVAVHGNLAENEEKGVELAVDLDGNVFVSIEGKLLKKIDPEGNATFFADVSFLKANGMKMGPGNTIYAAYAAGRVKKIATIAPDGTEGTYASISKAPSDFDFDAAGNVWVVATTDIYLVKTDQSVTSIKTMPIDLKTARVFNNYLYFSGFDAGTGEAKIWKAEIQGETLGTEEVVLDIAAADWLAGITVSSFTLSEDGKIFLATDTPTDAILIYNPADGSNSVLHPGLIGPNIVALKWTSDNIIYAIQQLDVGSNVLKIRIFENGAPYYGRQ